MPQKFGLERRDYHDFLSKIICLTLWKNSVGGLNPLAFHSFWASIKFGQEGGRQYQNLPSKFFCLTVPRTFVGKPFSVSLLSGAEEVWINEGVGSIKIFCPKFFFSQCRKFS